MHELSITQNILDLALEKAQEVKAKEIKKVNLVIGEMTGVVGECVQFYFDLLSKGTQAEHASISVNTVPTKVRCRVCGHSFVPGEDWVCPQCQDTSAEIIAGKELFVESIEVE